jgi:hypothetical protein
VPQGIRIDTLSCGTLYYAPARVEVEGKIWTFTDSETGRVIGMVTFSGGPKFTAKNGMESGRRLSDLENDDSVYPW